MKYIISNRIKLSYFKKIKNVTQRKKEKSVVSGEGSVNDQKCQKWITKFRVEDFFIE